MSPDTVVEEMLAAWDVTVEEARGAGPTPARHAPPRCPRRNTASLPSRRAATIDGVAVDEAHHQYGPR